MNIRHYLATMALATVLCWLSWAFVLVNVDPFETNHLGFVFFYSSLFFALVGTCSIVLFFIYVKVWKTEVPLFLYVSKSFRESFLVAGFFTLTLWLLGGQLLNWLTFSLLITGFVLLISLVLSLAPRGKTEARSNVTFLS